MKRRDLFSLPLAAALAGCDESADRFGHIDGGFTGISFERGHQLREARPAQAPGKTEGTRVLIAGGGVAGLAAARALRLAGVDDVVVLELEDTAGGNSRGGSVSGLRCPLGAHYLPLPSDDAPEVQDLLEEFGLRRRVAGRWTYDERHLCHTPQERLFYNGGDGWHWQEGLLPLAGVGAETLAQYRRFATLVDEAQRAATFTIPSSKRPVVSVHTELDAMFFEAWLTANGLTDARLRWYLDYCCRDDYGAGIAQVSAWAGLHYFASRHGFHAPGHPAPPDSEGLLTWPEGNAWLAERLAAPLGERLKPGRVVTRIACDKHGVTVDALNTASGATERWTAERCVVALPLFVAARVVENPPPALAEAAAKLRYAPWLVANVHIAEPLFDRPGAPPSWDNVIYGSRGLGYVDAQHQSLSPMPGATVLTCYRALGDQPGGRRQLLERPWTAWRDEVLAELALPHPDIAKKATRIALTRYGHAMSMPVPGVHSSAALAALRQPQAAPWQRLRFAHADLAGYSIFEEAFTFGNAAGGWAARA